MSPDSTENNFEGPIASSYDLINLISPNTISIAKRIGEIVSSLNPKEEIAGFEIGCGTGICTVELLKKRDKIKITAIDSSSDMLDQARKNLGDEIKKGRLSIVETDALTALIKTPSSSMDFVASNFTIHNFDGEYRIDVLTEIMRVLKAGGLFINGDRYASDDKLSQLADTQKTISRLFKVFLEINRIDLLEEWILHLMRDESPSHIMYLTHSIGQLKELGFSDYFIDFRDGTDTLIIIHKPK